MAQKHVPKKRGFIRPIFAQNGLFLIFLTCL